MQCEDLAAMLTEFLEGELDHDTEEEAIEHLASCNHCELVLAETREVTRLARDHGRAVIEDSAKRRLLDGIVGRISENED